MALVRLMVTTAVEGSRTVYVCQLQGSRTAKSPKAAFLTDTRPSPCSEDGSKFANDGQGQVGRACPAGSSSSGGKKAGDADL